MSAAIRIESVSKSYRQGARILDVVRGVSLEVAPGEIVGLMGQSGAGKSTLLHIAGLLERPSSGAVYIADQSLADASERNRTRVRLDALGFVYQFHHLLPEFSAIENVAMPLIIAGSGTKAANMRASELLERLGLGDRLTHRPAQLSGGEQQRVAIARALANRPAVLLADEPTGNLDEDTAGRVMNELVDVAREHNLAALVATHNPGLAERMDRTLTIRGGKLV
ncbi:lipoprotein-releasing system ATP-binding protein LolD 1 [Iodidimonas muriae]|uniref:Lipoprotein-releasing system ATP-binding protein LolD 1 n=1 Tax=Iodidimonas muriae TaxID=261467 RepID=A0ABQ2L7H0_9PROT|nr:ABC transporter ATP-binding protein [Iodidimonas muriae]GER08419.1 lipoprotein-releasing system ATP-binding protein LolD 1 [Kordiimonadales bacterium JCM 17843]GGO05990.1 lipoprotein-releasing system ATP-binding protein LolD 1 [Iodidimonas muriae]